MSFPDSDSRNSEYGQPHGRSGSVVSSTPMPGTITTSCLRTQFAVRKASTSLPSPFRTTDESLDAVAYSSRYQFMRTARTPCLAETSSGPEQNTSS